MSTAGVSGPRPEIGHRFNEVRQRTLALCEPLTPEDMMVQSCPEASPAKWHLAHTTWFFESFVLREFLPGYRLFHEDFPWLFNSYYESFSAFPEKRLRSSFSRPGLEEVLRYRAHVDAAMERLFEREPEPEALRRIELGVNHEEQHQELLLTDILNAFFTNPLRPKYREQGLGNRDQKTGERGTEGARENSSSLEFRQFEGGLREAGHAGEGFCYDNELPRHRVWLEPYKLANRLVTCGEFAEFMADGGYQQAGVVAFGGVGCGEGKRLARAALLDGERRRVERVYAARRAAAGASRIGAGEPGKFLRGRRLRALGGPPAAHRV